MKTSDFYYDLPEELIAQDPLKKREMSKLMVLDKKTGAIEHKVFKDVIEYLNPGDCLVINDTKVLPARLYGKRFSTGGIVEILLLKSLSKKIFHVDMKNEDELISNAINQEIKNNQKVLDQIKQSNKSTKLSDQQLLDMYNTMTGNGFVIF